MSSELELAEAAERNRHREQMWAKYYNTFDKPMLDDALYLNWKELEDYLKMYDNLEESSPPTLNREELEDNLRESNNSSTSEFMKKLSKKLFLNNCVVRNKLNAHQGYGKGNGMHNDVIIQNEKNAHKDDKKGYDNLNDVFMRKKINTYQEITKGDDNNGTNLPHNKVTNEKINTGDLNISQEISIEKKNLIQENHNHQKNSTKQYSTVNNKLTQTEDEDAEIEEMHLFINEYPQFKNNLNDVISLFNKINLITEGKLKKAVFVLKYLEFIGQQGSHKYEALRKFYNDRIKILRKLFCGTELALYSRYLLWLQNRCMHYSTVNNEFTRTEDEDAEIEEMHLFFNEYPQFKNNLNDVISLFNSINLITEGELKKAVFVLKYLEFIGQQGSHKYEALSKFYNDQIKILRKVFCRCELALYNRYLLWLQNRCKRF